MSTHEVAHWVDDTAKESIQEKATAQQLPSVTSSSLNIAQLDDVTKAKNREKASSKAIGTLDRDIEVKNQVKRLSSSSFMEKSSSRNAHVQELFSSGKMITIGISKEVENREGNNSKGSPPLSNTVATSGEECYQSENSMRMSGAAEDYENISAYAASEQVSNADRYTGGLIPQVGGLNGFSGDIENPEEELAVAKPVTENEGTTEYITSAVEYDPESKKALIFKRMRIRLHELIVAIVLFVASIVTILHLVNSNDGEHQENIPSTAPTTFREALGIQERIETVIGISNVGSKNSPHFKALNWIINKDPLQLPAESDRLIQRFILALFYFQTSVAGPWRSCTPPTRDENSSCVYEKLVQFWPEMVFDSVEGVRWLSDRHECEWTGVICDGECDEVVTALELRAHNLSGPLPTEIVNLPKLNSFIFATNHLNGTLPKEIATELKHLTNVELNYNDFSGSIPTEWFSLRSLVRLNLGGNSLTGTIPSEINLPDLQGLFLFDNMISGTIPPSFFSMRLLTFTRLSKNRLEGPLPTGFGKLTNLQELWLHKSKMFGTLPTEIGNMKELRDIRVQFNNMSGEIPDELFSLPLISRIDLWENKLTGTISPDIGKASSLSILRLMNNSLTGTVPTQMGLLTQLKQVWLEHNDFVGVIPDEVCMLRNDSIIQELRVNCLPSNITGLPQLKCKSDCCTTCCDQGDQPQCISF